MRSYFECIVIGSGPGGAVTAMALAEAGRDVLIIEEGPAYPPDESKAFGLFDLAKKYRHSGLTFAMGQPRIAYVEGKLWGGGSEVNAGLYHRTPPNVLDEWAAEFDLKDATEKDLEPRFKFMEELLDVQMDTAPPMSSRVLSIGAERLGWQCVQVPRWIRAGQRQSMSVTALKRATLSGAQALIGVRAVRIQRAGKNWEVLLSDGRRIDSEKIYLCGGAVQSPLLLKKSGISKRAGSFIQIHPSIKFVAKFPFSVNGRNTGIPSHQIKEFAPAISLGGSISSLPHLAMALADYPKELSVIERDWHNLAIYYTMIRPRSRGRVRMLPFWNSPQIFFQMSTAELKCLADGHRHLAELLFTAGASAVYPTISGGCRAESPADLSLMDSKLIRKKGRVVTLHLFSSCPMGEKPGLTITDSFGRIRGVKNLYVNDGSLLCSAPGVNPQGSIMAFALRNVEHHLADGDF